MYHHHSKGTKEHDRGYNRRDRDRSQSQERRKKRRSRSKSPRGRESDSIHRSRSRSKDRDKERYERRHSSEQGRQSYDERAAEEVEQKVRLAIRNNEIHFDPKAQQAFSRMTANKQEEITQQAQSAQKIHEYILVRELFVSGLNQMNEGFISQILGKYGEIQNIQILKNFAFVRFFKVEDASNACAQYHTINLTLHSTHNPNFKIFFADHMKRWNVVSNHLHYQVKEHLVPVVYASIKNDLQFANEDYLRNLFGKFGYIRNLQVHRNEQPGPKIYALIEYETLAQAMRSRDKIKNQREVLGDRRCEITVLIDTDKITRQFPNISNQLRYQKKRQMSNAHNNPYSNTHTPISSSNPMMNPQMGNIMNPQMGNMMNPPMGNMMNPPVMNNSSRGAEDIFAMIKQLADKKQPQIQQPQTDWSGFMTRNKCFKVEVDMHVIHKVPFDLEGLINISHRGDLYEGLSRPGLYLAAKFRASNTINTQNFQEYIKYFKAKKRAGVIQTRQYLIYLLPPLPELNLPYSTSSRRTSCALLQVSGRRNQTTLT